jgi:hypothetical protein
MRTREQFLAWAKDRALEYARRSDKAGCIASFVSDCSKWEGGQLYDAATLAFMTQDAMLFRSGPDELVDWVEGFN